MRVVVVVASQWVNVTVTVSVRLAMRRSRRFRHGIGG